MAFGRTSWFYGYLGFLCLVFLLFSVLCFPGTLSLGGRFLNSFFIFDYVSFFLIMISLVLVVSLFSWWGDLSHSCRFLLLTSVFMSFLCYCSLNVLVFWVSYELCILPLLLLLVSESSYSERFIAFWYLAGYVVLTSVPLLLSLFYMYGAWGGFNLCVWDFGSLSWAALFIICVCFITKIPLPPFHVWLPIVHAEASSPVSVFLSGFIMKLGILGVFRFAYLVLPYSIFSYLYILPIFCGSVGFLILSSQELDGKRWLAILSLSHIVLGALGLLISDFSSQGVPFIFCLGHGLSAGLIFIFLWFVYNVVGSRNWNLVKFSASSSFLFRLLFVASLCSAGSLPPTISFFSEVRMFIDSGVFSYILIFLFLFYLFFSGLVPLFVLGGCLSRHFSICSSHSSMCLGGTGSTFLVLCCFLFFLFI